MPQLLTLARAARLVGVTRGALQKRIKNGELTTFERQVEPTECLAPLTITLRGAELLIMGYFNRRRFGDLSPEQTDRFP